MMNFKPSKILSVRDVISEELRQSRLSLNLELETVAKKLNIKYEYLEALEQGEYSKLPAGVYGKSFLKEYAFFLGLNANKLAKDFEIEEDDRKEEKNNNIFCQQIIKKYNFLVIPKIIRSFLVISVASVCLFYLGFCLKKIIAPPLVEITGPADNLSTTSNFIVVSGKTEREAEVAINGEPISLNQQDDESVFTKKVNLKSGLNIIVITARKKYGREITIKRQILVNELVGKADISLSARKN